MAEPAAGVYRLNLNNHASAQTLSSALHVRRYTLQAEHRDASRAAVLLSSGEGAIGGAGETIALLAPCLLWLPIQPGHYLRVAAGSSGELLTLSDMLVRDAIGQGVESIHLRALNERASVASAIAPASVLGEVALSFAAIAREGKLGERGSWSFLTAHVALILVHCWRLSGLEDDTRQGFHSHSVLLVKFRHLVETHFRDRWKIADYARSLAVSHDRLHDTCVRMLQRTPLDLLHDRLTHEASLRLARSGLSIEALADDLGFSSPPHFSRFFKQRTGFTPAGYRKVARDATKESQILPPSTYADWP
ncbi:MAG: helix-turn-helix domain-containing protein [Burkholderiales bacterium]|nr:helix-turn-helix domain-containing protein [Burkholderiales bacterium]